MKKLLLLLSFCFLFVISGGAQGTETWVKVTEAPTDWSGDYLIVYEAEKEADRVAFDGSLTKLDAAKNKIGVTIDNGKITTTDCNFCFTININSEGNGYTIQSKSGYYIGRTDYSNGLDSSTSTANIHTISINDDGTAAIKSSGGTYLRYNAASDQLRFRYYKSGQKAITLYKKQESGSTEVNPTPKAPVFSVEGGYVEAGTVVTVTYENVDDATIQLYAGGNAVEGTSYTVNETVTLTAVVTNKYGKTAEATVTYMVATPFLVSDILTVSDTKATSNNSYAIFEGVQKNGAEYAGKNAKNEDIQLGYNASPSKSAHGSEIVMTKSIGTVSRIIITWSTTAAWPTKTADRGVEIFGKQQPYKAGGAQLMDQTVSGWNIATLLYDNRDENNQTIYDVQYELNGENVPIYYIGIRPTDKGAVYIKSIEFIWNDSFEGGAETTYSLAASVSENNFVVLATGNIAVSREDASNGEAVEFDENSIALAKGQTTVDEFQVVNSYTQGGVTYFNLYGGVENMLVNNRHYLAEATFVIDENSASLFYMDVDGYLRYADDNSYYAYNGTSFAKSTDITGAVKVYSNTTGKTTDVEAVEIEDIDAPVEYYNLQGVRVAKPQNGLYIVRQGNKVSKQIIR